MSKSDASSLDANGGGVAAAAPSMSSSSIVAKTASGSHVLKIDGYSRTTGFGFGKFFTSKSFQVGGRRWCLRYYPDGYNLLYHGWVSILLCLDPGEADEVRALYKIILLDQEGLPVASYVKGSLTTCITFTGKGEPHGSYRFITNSDLKNPLYLKADAFSVRCDITVVSGIITEDVVIPVVEGGIKKEAHGEPGV